MTFEPVTLEGLKKRLGWNGNSMEYGLLPVCDILTHNENNLQLPCRVTYSVKFSSDYDVICADENLGRYYVLFLEKRLGLESRDAKGIYDHHFAPFISMALSNLFEHGGHHVREADTIIEHYQASDPLLSVIRITNHAAREWNYAKLIHAYKSMAEKQLNHKLHDPKVWHGFTEFDNDNYFHVYFDNKGKDLIALIDIPPYVMSSSKRLHDVQKRVLQPA